MSTSRPIRPRHVLPVQIYPHIGEVSSLNSSSDNEVAIVEQQTGKSTRRDWTIQSSSKELSYTYIRESRVSAASAGCGDAMSYSSFAAGSEASHFNSSQMNGATSETMSSTYVAPPAEKKKKKHKDRNGDKKKKKSKQKKRESSASEALVADLDAWEEGNRVPPDEWVRPRNAEIAITEVSPTRLRSAVRSRTVEENMELSPQQEDVEISLQSEETLQESFAEEWNAALASVASQQANEETFGN